MFCKGTRRSRTKETTEPREQHNREKNDDGMAAQKRPAHTNLSSSIVDRSNPSGDAADLPFTCSSSSHRPLPIHSRFPTRSVAGLRVLFLIYPASVKAVPVKIRNVVRRGTWCEDVSTPSCSF
jgi:hypothetical protein